MSTPREIVIKTTNELFGSKYAAAVDRCFGPRYVQHNPTVADGLAGLRELAVMLAASQGFNVTTHRVIAESDLIAMHSSYSAFGPEPLIAFDIFRVADGRIVEH